MYWIPAFAGMTPLSAGVVKVAESVIEALQEPRR